VSDIWLDDLATGAGDGTSYVDAYTTLAAVAAVAVSGDRVLMVHTHTQATAVSLPARVSLMSVNSSGVYTKSAIYNFSGTDISVGANLALYGIGVTATDDFTVGHSTVLDDCRTQADSSQTGFYNMASNTTATGLRTVKGGEISLGGSAMLENGTNYYLSFLVDGVAITANGSGPHYFCDLVGVRSLDIEIRNVDFAAAAVQSGIFTGNLAVFSIVKVSRCVIPAGFIIQSGSISIEGAAIVCSGLDVGDGYHYFYEKYRQGEVLEETGIYRNAGATYDGTNHFSTELVSNTNATTPSPLATQLGSQYIDTDDFTTTVTVTVHFAVDGSTTALNDDEFWIEVEYADGADNALGVIASTKAEPLVTAAAPTTETALWTGLGGTNKQMSISKTITIGTTAGTIASGLVRVTAYMGKASQTAFVCPQFELS